MAVLASLLVLPLSLVAIELVLLLVGRITSTLSFLLIDVFPRRDSITVLFGRLPYYMTSPQRETWVEITDASDSVVFGLYGQSLRQGYTLLGAIPASLALGRTTGYDTLHPRDGAVGLSRLPDGLYAADRRRVCSRPWPSRRAGSGLLSTIDSRRSSLIEAAHA